MVDRSKLTLKSVPDTEADAFFDMLNDPTLAVHTGTIPLTITREWALERLAMKRALEDAGKACERGLYLSGKLVGTAGWFLSEDGGVEIGYAIHRDHRGKGLATEAAAAVVKLARDGGHTGPIYAKYFTDNPASGRVLEKLGFQKVGEDEGTSVAREGPSPSITMRFD